MARNAEPKFQALDPKTKEQMRSPKTKSVISLWLALAALLTLPAASGADTFYVSNLGSTIQKFAPSGVGSSFADTGLTHPVGLAFDSNLYAANQIGDTIWKFTPDGAGSLFASTGLSQPTGLAFDSAGNLYAANHGGN